MAYMHVNNDNNTVQFNECRRMGDRGGNEVERERYGDNKNERRREYEERNENQG